jgi:hypothetical protein
VLLPGTVSGLVAWERGVVVVVDVIAYLDLS